MTADVDVLIVGAGLSGICAAHYLGDRCPDKTFAMWEARDEIGGTWDLFRYPGIRSDSEMYTLGFSFFPWKGQHAIADGGSILEYLRAAADDQGVTERVEFRRRVVSAHWSSEHATWTVSAVDPHTEERHELTCRFLWWCSGYYDYAAGYTPDFAGRDDFAGQFVHPQHWPADLDCSGKRVVVIGSGATAMTLVPALARQAAHVTMLQRTPGYVLSRPQRDVIARGLTYVLGSSIGSRLARWKNVFLATAFYELARWQPRAMRAILLSQVRRAIGSEAVADHFSPTYDVWDQRVCIIPDQDFFRAFTGERATVVTDHIERFTPRGVALKSGAELEADVIVSATGFRLQFAGGAQIWVDGETLSSADGVMYKGAMLSGIPNSALVIGYTNASWTLKSELIAAYVCRLLKHMDEHGHRECRPRRPDDLVVQPLINFSSGYVERARAVLPAQGTRLPWRVYQNYLLDSYLFGHAPVDDGALEFR